MTAKQIIDPLTRPLNAVARPPGSKSLTNRAIVIAALADGTTMLDGVLESQDTSVMIDAWRALGVAIEEVPSESRFRLRIVGCGGRIPVQGADLFVANSGTTMRFLTPVVALGHGRFRLHGSPRMHERPIQDLLDALSRVGVDAASEEETGCPPVVVRADGLRWQRASIRGAVSSQFLSGLLMVAPCVRPDSDAKSVQIAIDGLLVSRPYVAMTLGVMEAFGARVEHDDALTQFSVPLTGYQGRDYVIEPDATAASYFWGAAAIAGGRVRVEGLTNDSLQGDVAFCQRLAQMGCRVEYDAQGITVEGRPLRGIDTEMNAISDTVQTLAVVALFAEGPTTIRGVAHIRHKETDRISALAVELRKLGATVEERPDGLQITPGTPRGAAIETYDDHRMAMSFALAGLRIAGVAILDPDCTAKTYPNFFEDLARLTE